MEMFLEDYTDIFEYQLMESTKENKGYFIRGVVSRAGTGNKNKRIYPIPVMESAVEELQEAVANGGFVGEIEHPCVGVSDFSILGKDGWKDFLEYKVGDEVATFNEDNIIEYNKIETIINEPYKGKIYNFKGRNIDIPFTGPHRLYLENRYGKREIVTVKEVFDNRKKYNKHKIIKIGKWEADTNDVFIIKGISKERYNKKFKQDVRKSLELNTKAFMSFIGFYLAEGCTSKRDNEYKISISQNEGIIADEFREVLKQLPFEVKEYSKKRRDNIITNFVIQDIRLHEYLKPLGDCYTKYIPTELKQLDAPYLEELIDWFIKGDGRDRRGMDGGSNRRNLFSVSKRLIEDLHELVIKVGGSGNWTEIDTTEDYMFADHLIEAKNKHTLYQLNLSTTKGIYLDERFLSITEEDHDDNIYCITVPNGNFYMKHKGKSYLTGNSSPKVNIERISHKITKLKMAPDGAVLAEMTILNTPQGNILKNLIDGGVQLGVSTRGLGGIKPYHGPLGEGFVEVQPGFKMKAIDVVFDPSAGIDGRPNFVTEETSNSGIILGHTTKFERVWNDVFGD